MNVVVFGTGNYYNSYKGKLEEIIGNDRVVAYSDNKYKKNEIMNGKYAVPPQYLQRLRFDCVIVMSGYVQEIKEQLVELGVDEKVVYTFEYYKYIKTRGKYEVIECERIGDNKKALIISEPIGYEGGGMVTIYLAYALIDMECDVWLMVTDIDNKLKKTALEKGINIVIATELPYVSPNLLKFIKEFDIITVNIFTNINVVRQIDRIKHVIWWIHENDVYSEVYRVTLSKFFSKEKSIGLSNTHILAVSVEAKKNFNKYFPNTSVEIMPYGIPDERINWVKRNKIVFALIGGMIFRKGQDVFLKAIQMIPGEKLRNVEFWLIGNRGNDDFSSKIMDMIRNNSFVKYKGEMDRNDLICAFSDIDVVVSASREETMSLVITEGLMQGKICIASNVIGMAKYICDSENGFVFKNEDANDLKNKILYCIENDGGLDMMKKKARETYEKFFTMSIFENNLKEVINNIYR